MSRLFTAASSHYVRTKPGWHIEAMTWGPHTFAAVIRRASDSGWHTMQAALTSAGTSRRSWSLRGDSNKMQIYDGGTSDSTFTVLAADGWCLVACTKASGTVTPWFHKYKFSTNEWTHEAGSATQTDGSAIGAGGFIDVGRWQTTDFFNGDIQATTLLKQEMSQGDLKRLAGGNWSMREPDSLIEFGPDDNLVWTRDFGRCRGVQTAVTGTTRSASAGAPGFRHSVDIRRR